MENDMKILSNENEIIGNERDNLKMLVADLEKERKDLNNQLKDTIDKCNIMSSELEKAILADNEVHTLLVENQKLKNDNLMLLAEQGDLKAQLQNLDVEYSKLRETITYSKAENESLNKQLVEVCKSLNAKIAALYKDKDITLLELQKSQASVKKFEGVVEKKNVNILSLQQANNELQKSICTLTEQSEQEKTKLHEEIKAMANNIAMLDKQLVEARRRLHAKVSSLHEEKNATQSELQASQASLKNIESVVENQNQNILSLQQANEEFQKTICVLTEQSEQEKAKLQEEIKAMANNIALLDKQFVEARRSLHAKIASLREEKNAILLELQASQASVKNNEGVAEKQNKKILSLEQANEEFQKIICTLIEQSEQEKAKLQGELKDMANNSAMLDKQLVEARRSLHAKIASLHEEKNAALLELQASQASMKNIEGVVENQNQNILSLQQANKEFQKTIFTLTEQSEQAKANFEEKIKAMTETIARSESQLVKVRKTLHAKIMALHKEKGVALSELQASQNSIRSFKCVVEKQNENISSLQQANDELQKNMCTLTEQSEQAKAKFEEKIEAMLDDSAMSNNQLMDVRRSFHAKIATLLEEKNETLSWLQASQVLVKNFEGMVEKQNETIISLQHANDESQKKICTLIEQSEQEKAKLQEELKVMVNNTTKLENQLVEVWKSLHAKIASLHEEKDAALSELQASQASVKNIEGVVEKQNETISSLQQANEELQKTIFTLTEQSEQDKVKFEEKIESMIENIARLDKQLVEARRSHHAKIVALRKEKDVALLELNASQASVKNFECLVERQNENISSLQQANDELKKTIHILTDKSEQEKLKAMANNIDTLDKQLVEVRRTLYAKIATLLEEKDEALSELQASQNFIRNLEGVVEKQNENIVSLQQGNDVLQKTIDTLTEQSQQEKAKLKEEVKVMANNIVRLDKQLMEVRRSLQAKIVALHEEKDATLLKLQISEASVKNFEGVIEKQNKDISSLQQANDELQKIICTLTYQSDQAKAKLEEKVQAMIDDIARSNNQLVEVRRSLHAKIVALRKENDTLLLELHASQASITNLECVVEKQSENIYSLQQANDELQKNICTLTEQSEQAQAKLQEDIKATQKDRDTIVARLKQSESLIKNLENEVARLIKELSIQLDNNSTLDGQLEEETFRVSNLSETLAKSQSEMASHIDGMSTKTKELENTINVLHSQRTKVEEDLKVLAQACTGNKSLMKEFEDTVNQQIMADDTRLGSLYLSLRNVIRTYQQIQYAHDEISAKAFQLEVLKENQMKQIGQLQEKNNEMLGKIHQLKEEKLNTLNENTKLHKHVQDLESQLQHVKQKLIESKWKEDCFAAALEKSKAEIQNQEQLAHQFSRRASLLEETLNEVKEHAESGVFSLIDQLDKLELSLSQGFPRFVYRSSASSEELKAMRKKLQDHLDEQKELLNKNDEVDIRSRDEENVFSEMVKNDAEARILEQKVQKKERGGEITNNTTISSKRWPVMRRRWRRNSYSC